MIQYNFLLLFFIGILIGIFGTIFYIKYINQKDFTKPVLTNKVLETEGKHVFVDCVNKTLEAKQSMFTPNSSSLILNVESEKNKYYEVSIYDEKDKLLWVKENVSQVDLTQFANKKNLKYKIYNPFSDVLSCNVFETPKITQTFNDTRGLIKRNDLKYFSETEKDYQEACVEKILNNHNIWNVKKTISGTESKKDFSEGQLLSKKSKISFDRSEIKTNFDKVFLVYPAFGYLLEMVNTSIKNEIHENFNIKVVELVLDMEMEDFSVSCLCPNVSLDSEIFLFKVMFV